MEMSGPLKGIKIVELAHWVAAPCAAAILTDWGADTIKIEDAVGGDVFRAYRFFPCRYNEKYRVFDIPSGFEMDNRGKRSIALDLRHKEGQEILCKLVATADVFLTNFIPDVLQKLGADYETLKKVNEALVYASISGYGDKGPNKDLPGFDWSAYWASSGMMLTLGEPGGPPVMPRAGIGDHPSGVALTAAILAALLYRERTGVGQKVSVALLNCGLWQLSYDIVTTLMSGQNASRVGRGERENPLSIIYRTKDDKWIMLTMPQSDRLWESFCQAVGREDLIHEAKYENLDLRAQNAASLIAIFEKEFASKTGAEWGELLTEHGCIWAPVNTCYDASNAPQAWENDFLCRVEHPILGEIKLVKAPGHFSKTPSEIKSSAPQFGQHTEEVLLEFGYTWEDMLDLKEREVIG